VNHVIKKRPAVLVDLESIAAHIGRDRPRTALRFLKAAEKAFRLLSEFPTFGSTHPLMPAHLSDVRCSRFVDFGQS
jgi:plasmid stabilization system protein ParE